MFLGHEFLTWLWFVVENDHEKIEKLDLDPVYLETGNRIVLENRREGTVESITIKGDDAGLEEGVMALSKGASVKEINLSCKIGEQEWQVGVQQLMILSNDNLV